MNPFRGNNRVILRPENLPGRQKAIHDLQQRVENELDTLLLGVEGSGKSSLLNCAMNNDFRSRMLLERNILITRPFVYPVSLKHDSVFPFLIDQIVSALNVIQDEEQRSKVRSSIDMDIRTYLLPDDQFKSVINTLFDSYQYTIVLVIDNLERFTCSTEVNMAQHELMRDLLEKGQLRFLVATDYDVSKDSLPVGIKGSYLLQKFSDCEYVLSGLKEDVILSLLDRMNNLVTETQLEEITEHVYDMTHGIPVLVNGMAAVIYDYLENKPFDQWDNHVWQEIENDLYVSEPMQKTLQHWCNMLSEDMVRAMNDVYKNHGVVNNIGAAGQLVARNLLVKGSGGQYPFVTPLLERYIREDKLKVTTLKLPTPNPLPDNLTPSMARELIQLMIDRVNQPDTTAAMQTPVDQALLEKEQFTLDSVYEKYRTDYPMELSDDLAESLGERLTGLKQALLYYAFLDDDGLGDTSRAVLNQYGVVLEGCLYDCMFDLFMGVPDLQGNNCDLSETNKTIGAFEVAIRRNKGIFVQMCANNGLANHDSQWWDSLITRLQTAQHLRNPADHDAKVSTEDARTMHTTLLTDGLLNDLRIGKELLRRVCNGARLPRPEEQRGLIGQEFVFRCDTIRSKGSLKGLLEEKRLAASVAAGEASKAVERLWNNKPATVGDRFRVKVVKFEITGNVFGVIPVSEILP